MASKPKQKPNHLAYEKSPYLLQHMFNPVDWFPWSEEAFSKARQEDKPVFLSIGYSTCHWCHVMEKESFQDPEVAELLNETFVCIKVDREERPDLDATYMKVVQTLTGTGGWPLHIIMTPDKKPFFATTYIPKEESYGRAGIKQLTKQIKTLWLSKRSQLLESANNITNVFDQSEQKVETLASSEKLGEHTLHEAYLQLSDDFDERNGGFGHAPKFPSPQNLTFLLRYWKRTAYPRALQMVEKTLQSMRLGGIYDQLGFGFHRYSTDSKWLVPHFEKMLYDQAMLLMAYAESFQATRKQEFAQIAQEIATYVLSNLTDSQGGFLSAEDADSEGEEGKYYLWTEEQISQTLPENKAELIKKVFNVERDGNYEEIMANESSGKNILFLRKTLTEIAGDLKIPLPDLHGLVEETRKDLLVARSKRVHPNKDDKILTDWNGLMIAALTISARVFDKPDFAKAAEKAADFIVEKMIDTEGKLCHRYRDGEAAISGFLDDYAFFVWGLIELYETVFDAKYLKLAVELTDKMLAYFWDSQQGGFFQIASFSEIALTRNKGAHDGAYPSGNSVAAFNLIRLAHMTSEMQYEEKARQLLQAFSAEVTRLPSAYSQMMIALDFALGPSTEVVIAGDLESEDTKRMLRTLESRFIPRKIVLLRRSGKKHDDVVDVARFSEYFVPVGDKTTAYVCKGHVCNLPTTDAEVMLEQVDS
jgi:uncharacterized protein YyaL (SSP411 family)